MKKIVCLSLILLITVCLTSSVFAASCKIDLKPSKSEISKGEEFTVDVIVKDIDAERGIIALTATMEYDKNALEYKGMEAQGKWTKPSYNDENGKLVLDRNDGYATTEETMFKVTFKAKEDISVNDTKIAIKEISSSNGITDIFSAETTTTIKIKNPGPVNPGEGDKPNTNTTPGGNTTGNTSNNNNKGNTTTNNNNKNNVGTDTNKGTTTNDNKTIKANTSDNLKNGVLPNAGTTSIVLGVILLVIAVALIIYTRIRMIDKGTNGGRW